MYIEYRIIYNAVNFPLSYSDQPKYLVLDATALQNLDVIEGNGDMSNGKGSLLYTIDQCASGMGKRLLRQWVCNPLTDPKDIIRRQEAVQDLMNMKHEMNELKRIFKSMPDLERLLRKLVTNRYNLI